MNGLQIIYILIVVVIMAFYIHRHRVYKLNSDGRCPICKRYIFRKSHTQDVQGRWWCRGCEREFDSIDRG